MTEAEFKPSQTAQFAAAHRAYHLMHDHPAILEDDAAGWLLGPPLSAILHDRGAPLALLAAPHRQGPTHQRLRRDP